MRYPLRTPCSRAGVLLLGVLLPARTLHAEPDAVPDDARPAVIAVRTESAASTEPEPANAPAIGRADIDAARARLRHEPSVERVLEAALRVEPPDESDALASRARLSGLLPTLGLKARRGQAVDLTATDVASGDGLRVGTDDDLTLEAALRFELDKLLFAREEVPLARERRAAHEAARSRAQQVIAVYFERKRLLLEVELSKLGRLPSPKGAKPTAEPLERELRIAELTALLDAFTEGAFSRMMENGHSRRP